MGAGGSGIDPAEFDKFKNRITSLESSVNSLNSLKTQVSDVSKAAASAVNYDALALAITKNDAYNNNLATAITTNPDKLSDQLANKIGANEGIIVALQNKLSSNSNLQKAMADTLSSGDYKIKFQGPKGEAGDITNKESLKSNLYDKGNTMWCADGTVCNIPIGKKGIDLSNGASADGSSQGIIAFKGWTDKLDVVGAGPNGNRWVKVWDNIDTGSIVVGSDVQGGGTVRVGGDDSSFKAMMTTKLDGGSVRSKGNIGVVNDANNDWKSVLDGVEGGRVYAKNRVQIGDWILYVRGDGHLGLHNGQDKMVLPVNMGAPEWSDLGRFQ